MPFIPFDIDKERDIETHRVRIYAKPRFKFDETTDTWILAEYVKDKKGEWIVKPDKVN